MALAETVDAARLLAPPDARLVDVGERSDLGVGLARLFASEAGRFCVEDAFRIQGGEGHSGEYATERRCRAAPPLLVGEGSSEIQRMLIGPKLLERPKL